MDKPPTYRYAAAISGEARYLTPSEYGEWKRRLLLDCGVVQHPAVALAVLPPEAGIHTLRLWPAIELLIKARVLGGTPADDPLPLTRRFLRRWVPMGEGSARAAMEELEALEFLTRAGSFIPKRGRAMNLWLPRARDDAGMRPTLVLPPAGEGRET